MTAMNRRMYRLSVQPFSDRVIVHDPERKVQAEGEDITEALLTLVEDINDGEKVEDIAKYYRNSGGVTYE